MFILGHIGVTLGIFLLLGFLLPEVRSHIDYRYVAFGALLPDLIDKPIGRVIFAESIANGRIIAHTLVFCFLLFSMGYYFYVSKRDTRILVISGAAFCHLLEDQMWTQATTFFWPIFGWDFPYKAVHGGSDYFFAIFARLFSPDISIFFILELIGLLILVTMIVVSFREKISL